MMGRLMETLERVLMGPEVVSGKIWGPVRPLGSRSRQGSGAELSKNRAGDGEINRLLCEMARGSVK